MLALLAMLAVSLATTSVLDRSVSHNYMDVVRARLVAKAGIEHAISRIQSMVQRGKFEDPSMVYWGSKTTETGQPDEDTPLSRALNPSYAIEDEDFQNPDDDKTTPVRFKFEDREIGLSGTMTASTYGVRSDAYRLRVSDANSRINVNDGLDDPDVTKNLRRILNHLGAACKVKEAGNRLIDKRPKIGYRTRKELKAVLGDKDFEKLGHHITPYAWADKNVVNPVPISVSTLGAYPVNYNDKIQLYRYGRSRMANGTKIESPLTFAPDYAQPNGFGHAVMALDEVNAQWIGRATRSPVNVNGASVEVLTALIADLRGVFMTERRKKNPAGGEYTFMYYPKADYAPGGTPLGAELGYLYATQPFIGPSDDSSAGTTTGSAASAGAVTASTIAEEIIQCRTGKRSKQGDFDYGSAWFGGPFRTWRQFNAFCDSLVQRGILADSRAIFFDYTPSDGGSGWFSGDWGSDVLIASTSQPKVAAQALADVLKANFNPNCTPNEINPDRNLYLEVDKTDLICNSTEFCFTPMGIFDVECEGLIVKTPRKDDLLKARIGVIQARETIECVVKIYDVYRETTQADFSLGDCGLRVRRNLTNSNKPLELGPEPEAGENPEECKWSGWIQLSTIGGIRRSDVKNAVMSTPKGEPENDACAYAHYQFDHRLNYHASDQQSPLQFSGGSGNQPDRTEQHAGPYDPARGGRGEYRLARDWSQLDPPPAPEYKAMSDLRIDGAYIERDGSLLYPCTSQVFATVGTIAFWLKPAFKPEMTGKVKTFFSTDTYVAEGGSMQQGWQLINGLWFFPAHDNMPYQNSANELSSPQYAAGPWRPVSICGGYATKGSYGGGVGHQTPSLNHICHSDNYKPSVFKHHEWIHVGYCWDMSGQNVHLLVNGVTYSQTPPEVWVHPQPTTAADWTSEDAIFRLGEPSTTMSWGSGSRNWTVDGTLDEFFMWRGNALATAAQLYDKGRYHVPRMGQEGVFTSQPILKDSIHGQKLPEPTSARPPIGPRREGGSRTTVAGPLDAPRPPDVLRPICAFWTWYPEYVDDRGKPMVMDGLSEVGLEPEVKMQLLLDGDDAGEALTDDGGSPIDKVAVKKGQKFQYRLKLTITNSKGGTLLRSTPVIDDVTLFYTQGVEYIHYNRVETDP
jgi:hypothetical protein